jgi:hypothetical protein
MQHATLWVALALVIGWNVYLGVVVTLIFRQNAREEARATGRDLRAREPIVAHAASEVY